MRPCKSHMLYQPPPSCKRFNQQFSQIRELSRMPYLQPTTQPKPHGLGALWLSCAFAIRDSELSIKHLQLFFKKGAVYVYR